MRAAIGDAGAAGTAEKHCAQHHGSGRRGGAADAQRLRTRGDFIRPPLSIGHRNAAFAEILLAMNGILFFPS